MIGRHTLIYAIFLCIALQACGYELQRARVPGNPTLEVPVFENETIETGIEAIIIDRIIDKLHRMPGWRIVSAGQGRYRLRGIVRDFSTEVLRLSPSQIAIQQRATIVIDVSLVDLETGKTLWREPAMWNFANYPIDPSILQSERNKLTAVAIIADRFGQRVRNRIQNTW